MGAQGIVDIDISLAPESMASQADTAALAQKWQVRVCCLIVYTRERAAFIFSVFSCSFTSRHRRARPEVAGESLLSNCLYDDRQAYRGVGSVDRLDSDCKNC